MGGSAPRGAGPGSPPSRGSPPGPACQPMPPITPSQLPDSPPGPGWTMKRRLSAQLKQSKQLSTQRLSAWFSLFRAGSGTHRPPNRGLGHGSPPHHTHPASSSLPTYAPHHIQPAPACHPTPPITPSQLQPATLRPPSHAARSSLPTYAPHHTQPAALRPLSHPHSQVQPAARSA